MVVVHLSLLLILQLAHVNFLNHVKMLIKIKWHAIVDLMLAYSIQPPLMELQQHHVRLIPVHPNNKVLHV